MARRVPALVDAATCVVLGVTMVVELLVSDEPVTGAGVALIVLSTLPLLVRRRHPLVSLVGCLLAMFVLENVVEIYQTIPFPSMVAGYTLARVLAWRWAVVEGLVVAPVILVNLAVVSEHALLSVDTAKNMAFVALPVVLGIAARNRDDYLAALVDRAETAERTREEEAHRRVGEERLRIARDLHDAVAHALVAINVQAGVAAHVDDPATAPETFRDIKRVSGEALADLRGTLGLLRTPGDDSAPVAPAAGLADLEELGARLGAAGVDVRLELDGAGSLPAAVDLTGYRIVQEALTNVMRHAGPTEARVRVGREADAVVIDVEDDGAAAPREPRPGSGNGVRGMRERALAAGGSLEAGPRAEGGWRVRARLPLAQAQPRVSPG